MSGGGVVMVACFAFLFGAVAGILALHFAILRATGVV